MVRVGVPPVSSASPFRRRDSESPRLPGVQWLESRLVGSARFAGFWSAVILPFALLGLVASGTAGGRPALLTGLLVVNLVALRLGRGYEQD